MAMTGDWGKRPNMWETNGNQCFAVRTVIYKCWVFHIYVSLQGSIARQIGNLKCLAMIDIIYNIWEQQFHLFGGPTPKNRIVWQSYFKTP